MGAVDWIGLDWVGLDWIGLDWIGLDWIELPNGQTESRSAIFAGNGTIGL